MTTVTRAGAFNGQDVFEIALSSEAGAEAKILTFGATVRDLVVPHRGGMQRVVLGFESFEPYPLHAPHFGAIAGRYCNRIRGGRFTLDGAAYQLPCNQDGKHHLHGGSGAFGKRLWSIVSRTKNSVTLACHSPDGEAGYPGAVAALCAYALTEPATLSVVLTATTDKPTIINLCHHSYFNLDGSPLIDDHHLHIAASHYTPTDQDRVTTGEIRSVTGTPYDFRASRTIAFNTPGGLAAYDNNFVLDKPAGAFAPIAAASSSRNGLSLEVWTTEPGVQLYDGGMLAPAVPGFGGVTYGKRSGFCLEAQHFPDTPNKPHFGSSVLRPGEVYRQRTEYRFS